MTLHQARRRPGLLPHRGRGSNLLWAVTTLSGRRGAPLAIRKRCIDVVCRCTRGGPLMVDDPTAVLTRYGVRVGRRDETTPWTHVLPIAAARSTIIAVVHPLYAGAEVSLDRQRAPVEAAFAAWGE